MIGKTGNTILLKILNLTITALPQFTSITQSFEWETMVTLMREQEWDTREETFKNINDDDHVHWFRVHECVECRMSLCVLLLAFYCSLFWLEQRCGDERALSPLRSLQSLRQRYITWLALREQENHVLPFR